MQLPAIVADVEALHGAGAGQQKRQAAIALAGSVLQIADAVSARQIVDPERFTAALGVLVDGIVACLNASLWRKSSPV
jgi:hypothetical protein